MKRRLFTAVAAVLISVAVILVLLGLLGGANCGVSGPVLAAFTPPDAPTVTDVDPASAPNDLDTPIVTTKVYMTCGGMRLVASWAQRHRYFPCPRRRSCRSSVPRLAS